MIIIDPGHGGRDPGAIGFNGTKEKNIVLKLSKQICILLKNLNYKTQLTRSDDSYPTWNKRVQSEEGDLFVSIHCNAASPQAHGIETLYYPSSVQGKKLATFIQNKLIEATSRRDRGIKKRGDLYVLRKTKCPAVVVEIGFISNPKEEKLINSSGYQTKVTKAIVGGIKKYLQ